MKFQHLFLIICAMLASGCGFQLRGTADIPVALRTMAVSSTDGNSQLLVELRRSLAASDVTLLDAPSASGFTLVVGAESSNERVLSVNSNARAGEFELSVSVPFQLRNGSDIVMGPETLTIDKVYLADPNSAVAKAEEREQIEDEIRRELVVLILRRLQSVSP